MSLKVNEIFFSIQGESSYAGRPCVFVRLTGCNLRCSYCDTQYAYHEGSEMGISDIVSQVDAYGCPLVEITGGEPLIQPNTPALIYALLGHNFHVLLETNGSLDTGEIDERCVKIIDIKCPSSGEHKNNDLRNLKKITPRDEIKMVIGHQEDYKYAKQILQAIGRTSRRPNRVHMSPAYGIMDPKLLAQWILDDRLDVSLNLQIHKLIWGPEQRSV